MKARLEQGLEDLRKLYETKGYVNFAAVPETSIDESRRTIDLFVDIDEGKPYNFGQLRLEGIEPYAGAGQALLNSWKTLEGKRYNSLELAALASGTSPRLEGGYTSFRLDEDDPGSRIPCGQCETNAVARATKSVVQS